MSARRNDFPVGLVLDAHKSQALTAPIVDVATPRQVLLSLDQGNGNELEPIVTVGQAVLMGEIVARPVDEFAAPLHSPVSGRVTAIAIRPSASRNEDATCIVIENDGCDLVRSLVPVEPFALDPAQLIQHLGEAGVVGLGGAAFPTATKLAAARQRSARTLLLNGAECEPWICCDDALMRSDADDVVLGARILIHALEATACTIAIEDDKPTAIGALERVLAASDTRITLAIVPAVYPRGAERQLIHAVFGLEVPSRGLPVDVGVTCQNVATAAAVARWVRAGEPCLSRVVTVTGSGVRSPRNVRARIGTPLADLVATAGGYQQEPMRLIAGGSMMGRALASDAAGLTKEVNCILVATREDLLAKLERVERSCIRCGDCATVCPPRLLPQQIHRAVQAGMDDAAVALGVFDCIDCGCCDYVCPSQIPLAQRFREARTRLRVRELEAARAAAARERFEHHERRRQEAALAEQRAFDAARDRARGGTPGTP